MKNSKSFVKKVMSLVLLSALVITMTQPVISHSQEEKGENRESGTEESRQFDINAPVINDLKLLQQGQTLKKEDIAILEIYAYDQDSDIEEINVSAGYEGGHWVDGEVSYNEEKECYEWKHKLENISGNKLMIYSVTVTDKIGHSTSRSTLENGEGIWADVEWQQPETEEVHITDFQLKQNGQTISETDLLEMSLETDKTFERREVFVDFQNIRGTKITVSLCADESGKVFRNSQYSVGGNAGNGKWTLSSIYIMDSPASPVKLYTDQIRMEDYSFTLKKTLDSGEIEETGEAPEITQVELEKNGEVLNAGEQASITIYVSDKQEMQEIGYVSFRAVSDIRDQWKTVDLIYNKDRGVYEGTLTIEDEMYPCEWYVENIGIHNKLGNRADDSAYTSGGNYPYYILVKNGNTHVSPTYDFCVCFHVLDASGEWKEVQSVRKERIERRQTMKEAGIVFPDVDSEYPGVTQIGWVDSNGNEITEDSQCISDYGQMDVYAKYDKKVINIQYRSVSEEGRTDSASRKMLIPSDKTFGELKAEIESAEMPEYSYPGITFEGWHLDSTNGFQEDAPLPDKPQLSFLVSAVYDKNVLTVFYKCPVSNEEWKNPSKVIVYEKGMTYGELIDSAIEKSPEIHLEGYQFEYWEYNFNGSRYDWSEETKTDDSDNYMQMQCVSKFSGHAMITIRQCYFDKNGNWNFRYPIYMVRNGTKWHEVSKYIRAELEVPEICEDKTFDGWLLYPDQEEDESGVKNGLELTMTAQYYNPGANDAPTMTDRPDDSTADNPITDTTVIPVPVKPSDELPSGEQPGKEDESPDGEQLDKEDKLPSEEQPGKEDELQPGEQPGKEDELQPEDQQGQKSELSEEKIGQIVDIINKAESGKPIHVDMAEATVIPKEILEAAKGKNIEVTLDMGEYSWEVNGMDIAATDLKSIDLKVIMNTNNIPSKTIQAIAGENSFVRQISLVHEGDFGFKAKLSVNVGNEHAGKYGNLYYHDSAGKLVFIDAGKISSSGNVSLTFSHASDYMIVMSEQQMSQSDVPQELEPDAKPSGNQSPAESEPDQNGSGNQNPTESEQDQNGSGNQNQSGSGNQNSVGNGQGQNGNGNRNPTGDGQNQPVRDSQGQNGSGNKNQIGNEAKGPENNVQNESTALLNQVETNSSNQAASNNQNGVKNRSVQTGDETEAALMILTSMLSLGILVFILKKKRAY